MELTTAFRYRLYPSPEQDALFRRTAGCCRLVYNLALEQRRDHWRAMQRAGIRPGYVQQASELAALKAEAGFLKEAPHHCLQQALRDLDRAYTNFFAGKAGYPRPRRKGENDRFRFPDPAQISFRHDGTNRDGGKSRFAWLKLAKAGAVKLRLHRPLPPDAIIRNVTVARDGDGHWYASICVTQEIAVPQPDPAWLGSIVGIDLGVAQPIVVSASANGSSQGETIALPRVSPREQERERRLARGISRKKRGSRNRQRAIRALARWKARLARRRKDGLEKATSHIAKNHGVIWLEDLAVRNMTASARGTVETPGSRVAQKAGLNRVILDVAPGTIRRRLTEKVERLGGFVGVVPAPHTSQRCSCCGHIDPASRISRGRFCCTICGFAADADDNASVNIRDRGRGLWGQENGSPAGGRPVAACGDLGTSRSAKQEMSVRERGKLVVA